METPERVNRHWLLSLWFTLMLGESSPSQDEKQNALTQTSYPPRQRQHRAVGGGYEQQSPMSSFEGESAG